MPFAPPKHGARRLVRCPWVVMRLSLCAFGPSSYDEDLPHDFVHFVVEEELGLTRGVFGQLAAGGDAGTFRITHAGAGGRELSRARRRHRDRGRRLSEEGSSEAELSERAATICPRS